MIQQAIAQLLEGQSLSSEQAEGVMEEIMTGGATPAQIAGFLIALRVKGETVDEITGCARAMRRAAVRVPRARETVVDTCGTGGDRAGTFNISTTTAFVVAGAGLGVAKHGNRSVSSKSGSADVLEALGVNLDLTPEQVEALLAHELAHVRRLDPLVNFAQRVIEALLFFHPAVWLVSHRIRVEREHCCDDVVVGAGASATAYAS